MIYDITQEVFSARVYPGDPHPVYRRIKDFAQGDQSTVTEITLQVHVGTHMDAPIHRINGGKGMDEVELHKCIGDALVMDWADRAQLKKAVPQRILFKNCDMIDEETAQLLANAQVLFVGVEGQSVGDRAVHRILLKNEVAVLEGANLQHVPVGEYTLFAAPMLLGGCDGAPVRAVLVTK